MNIDVKVIAGAKKNLIKKELDHYKIYLTAPAVEGRANQALIAFLAEHFHAAKSQITITKGLKSRHKVVTINS